MSALARRCVLAALSCAFVLGCASVEAPSSSRPADDANLPKQLRGDRIIVTLAEDTPARWAATARALADEYGMRAVGDFPLQSIRVQCIVYEVAAEQAAESLIARLRLDPRVDSVQINRVFAGLRAHTDPYADLVRGALAIRADKAHRVSTGKGVKVVVIDTGADFNHADLRGRIVKTANFVEGGERSFARDHHGTAVAGVIGARADDGVGIFGIAPDAALIVAKACWYPSGDAQAWCSSWTLAKALDHAISEQAKIVNLSLAGPSDALLARLIGAAHQRAIVVVAAGAQDQSSPGFPAELESVIAVVSAAAKGKPQPPSWTKDKIALTAPGEEVLTTAPRDSYDFVSGSSLAAAHVSGIVALLAQHNPALTTRAAMELLNPAAGALVDACAALERLNPQLSCFN